MQAELLRAAVARSIAPSVCALTYGCLLRHSRALADQLRAAPHERVGLFATASADFAVALWGVWRSGGAAVPLSPLHPPSDVDYLLKLARVDAIVASAALAAKIAPLAERNRLRLIIARPFEPLPAAPYNTPPGEVACDPSSPSLVVATSGTTGRPKGVVLSHRAVAAAIGGVASAFGITADDRILNPLPLHHVHGIEAALLAPLSRGAAVSLLQAFDPAVVWAHLVPPRAPSSVFDTLAAKSPHHADDVRKAARQPRSTVIMGVLSSEWFLTEYRRANNVCTTSCSTRLSTK